MRGAPASTRRVRLFCVALLVRPCGAFATVHARTPARHAALRVTRAPLCDGGGTYEGTSTPVRALVSWLTTLVGGDTSSDAVLKPPRPGVVTPGDLLDGVAAAIHQVTRRHTQPSTSGGTSDGRFIATMGTQVVELGPVNATIHQLNECIRADDLNTLTDIYQATLTRLLG